MTSAANIPLEFIDEPALLISDGQITFANSAAKALLGGHIVGENSRIALRNPAAVALIDAAGGGRIRLEGLAVAGSKWEMACHVLENDVRLVTLNDISVQSSVARAHSDFVANASHELRTPLAAILGYVETLADDKAGGDIDTRARFLGIVKKEALRMKAIIDDLMSLSRIEASKHDTPNDPLDLVVLSREAVGEFPNGRITMVNNVDSAVIAGDRGQIAQVLRNLVDNAIKYGKADGAVEIGIEATATDWVSVTVRDEGDGIAPEHLPRLTERFYRADASRSREAGGTGLGLSIVKHIVERHRGRFDITSKAGNGTIASMMFKLSDQPLS